MFTAFGIAFLSIFATCIWFAYSRAEKRMNDLSVPIAVEIAQLKGWVSPHRLMSVIGIKKFQAEIVLREARKRGVLHQHADGRYYLLSSSSAPVMRQPAIEIPSSTPPIDRRENSRPAVRIPDDVLRAIRQAAEKEFPKDLGTQRYVIEKQKEDFSKLQKFTSQHNIDEEIFQVIVYRSQKEFPHDYSTQLFKVEEDVNSYVILANLKINGIPSSAIEAIKIEAARRHLYDFSTQLYVVNEEIEEYQTVSRWSLGKRE